MDYKDKLFKSYHSSHVIHLDVDEKTKIEWFTNYARSNYLKFVNGYDRDRSNILDIGCNSGYLLYSLSILGFRNLNGVDLSPDDIAKAKELIPSAYIEYTDAMAYLANHKEQFDIIIMKAVLEHIDKDKILPFLYSVESGLKEGGIALIDVPNMDWLFASHERYMDFTHEVGFTKESLRQIMSNVFTNVSVEPIDHIIDSSLFSKFKKRFARYVIGLFFSWADPEGASNPIWARCIIGIGKK